MVKLYREDIKTPEVLEWQGIHIFHAQISSCSQKLRIFLNLKNIKWDSHEINLMRNENITPWYLGINPRGLVPVLVHNGDVHIESNDILLYLENLLPEPALIPPHHEAEMAALLRQEDDLHLDFRALSFRFLFNPPKNPKPPEVLASYAQGGSGTVENAPDPGKAKELAFWQKYEAEGITDATAHAAIHKFKAAFTSLNDRLTSAPYLLGHQITMLDIAWFIYVNRLQTAGYPLARLHLHLATWFTALSEIPAFAQEIHLPPAMRAALLATHRQQKATGQTLEDIAAF